jgi:hypothetical protein
MSSYACDSIGENVTLIDEGRMMSDESLRTIQVGLPLIIFVRLLH